MCLGTLGIEPNGLGEVGNRLVEFALFYIGIGSPPIGLGTLWSEPNGLGVVGNRLVEVTLLVIDSARPQYASADCGLSRMASV